MDEVQASPICSPIFQNQDVLGVILWFVDERAFGAKQRATLSAETRRSLRSAALTSRAFFNPAISLLWRNLDSIVPLLKVFPSFVFANDIYTMNDIITPEDLKMVTLYSKHVRYLSLENLSNAIRGHVIHRLSSLRHPLFPNLQSVFIPSLDYSFTRNMEINLGVVFLALSKSLTHVDIRNVHAATEDHVVSFLSVLDQKQANLKDICLGGHLTNQTLCLLTRFSYLASIQINLSNQNLSSSIFRAWGTLPTLTHLEINADATSTLEPIGTPNGAMVNFPVLQDIQLGGLPPEVLNLLHSVGNSQTVKSITLAMSCPWSFDPSTYSVVLVECIAECVRISELLQVFRIRMPDVGTARSVTLPADALLHFIACKQLRHFEISAVNLCADDDIILSMCSSGAWKNLRSLQLPHALDDESPSLYSLNSIASYCPNLQALNICVDLRLNDYESLHREWEGPRKKHRLKKLTLLKLPGDNTTRNVAGVDALKMSIAVSRYIEYQFSNLKSLSFVANSASDQDWWKGILALMAEFQAIRAQTILEKD